MGRRQERERERPFCRFCPPEYLFWIDTFAVASEMKAAAHRVRNMATLWYLYERSGRAVVPAWLGGGFSFRGDVSKICSVIGYHW